MEVRLDWLRVSRGVPTTIFYWKGGSIVSRRFLLAAVGVLLLPLVSAQAGVRIGIGIGLPIFAPAPYYTPYYAPYYRPYYGTYYYPYAPAYGAPAPVYAGPAPLYVQPGQAPVYVQPQNQVYSQPVPQPAPPQALDRIPPPTPVPQN